MNFALGPSKRQVQCLTEQWAGEIQELRKYSLVLNGIPTRATETSTLVVVKLKLWK